MREASGEGIIRLGCVIYVIEQGLFLVYTFILQPTEWLGWLFHWELCVANGRGFEVENAASFAAEIPPLGGLLLVLGACPPMEPVSFGPTADR